MRYEITGTVQTFTGEWRELTSIWTLRAFTPEEAKAQVLTTIARALGPAATVRWYSDPIIRAL